MAANNSAAPPVEDQWEKFPVDQWRRAVFVVEGFFKDLYTSLVRSTEDIIRRWQRLNNKSNIKVRLIEIGCGTGEYVSAATTRIPGCGIGVDFNPKFVQHCKTAHKAIPNLSFVLGDAQQLGEELQKSGSYPQEDEFVIFACINNTLGIMPASVRENTLKEVSRLLKVFEGRSSFLVGYFDGEKFGEGVQYFYGQNPHLCGSLEGASLDWKNHVISTKDGYTSKWMTAAEACDHLGAFNLTCVRSESRDNGVIIEACRTDLLPKNPLAIDDDSSACQVQRIVHKALRGVCSVGLFDDVALATVSRDDVDLLCNATNRLAEWLADLTSLIPGCMLLDLSTGFGRGGVFIAKTRKCSVVAVDAVAKRCEIINERIVSAGISHRMQVACGALGSLSHLNTTFSHVVALDNIMEAAVPADVLLPSAAEVIRVSGVVALSMITRSEKAKGAAEAVARCKGVAALHTLGEVHEISAKAKLTAVSYLPLSQHLVTHCGVAQRELARLTEEQLHAMRATKATRDGMLEVLRCISDATQAGETEFGIFLFQKVQ